MIEFHETMDEHALEVWRVDRPTLRVSRTDWAKDCGAVMLGHIMWHRDREPRFESLQTYAGFTLAELDVIGEELRAQVAEGGAHG